jgi:hypothetical protein
VSPAAVSGVPREGTVVRACGTRAMSPVASHSDPIRSVHMPSPSIIEPAQQLQGSITPAPASTVRSASTGLDPHESAVCLGPYVSPAGPSAFGRRPSQFPGRPHRTAARNRYQTRLLSPCSHRRAACPWFSHPLIHHLPRPRECGTMRRRSGTDVAGQRELRGGRTCHRKNVEDG